jgi:hypothetical protein
VSKLSAETVVRTMRGVRQLGTRPADLLLAGRNLETPPDVPPLGPCGDGITSRDMLMADVMSQLLTTQGSLQELVGSAYSDSDSFDLAICGLAAIVELLDRCCERVWISSDAGSNGTGDGWHLGRLSLLAEEQLFQGGRV